MKKALMFACLPLLSLFSCARINHYKLTYTHDDFCDIVDAPKTVPDNEDLILNLEFVDGYTFKYEEPGEGEETSHIFVGDNELIIGITYIYDKVNERLSISYKEIVDDIRLIIVSVKDE